MGGDALADDRALPCLRRLGRDNRLNADDARLPRRRGERAQRHIRLNIAVLGVARIAAVFPQEVQQRRVIALRVECDRDGFAIAQWRRRRRAMRCGIALLHARNHLGQHRVQAAPLGGDRVGADIGGWRRRGRVVGPLLRLRSRRPCARQRDEQRRRRKRQREYARRPYAANADVCAYCAKPHFNSTSIRFIESLAVSLAEDLKLMRF